ncbi:MAG: isocitrate/isopropylmalate dehydrogenase family protein, partial [Rhodobacteraceae bacterium]|nr:isocitrate/isopropylmalate dehydrogenase family protein [Paracoccaceae bacterium]
MATATIAVMEGDGIGPEVTAPCLEIVTRAAEAHGATLEMQKLPAGAAHYAKTGDALPAESMTGARAADAILLAAMGLPDVRYPDGTEIGPQLDLRFEMGLYAGVRPVTMIAPRFSPLRAADTQEIDFVLVRESTEGMFASRRHGLGEVNNDQTARETLEITRPVTEKLFDFSFALALDRDERRRRLGQPERAPRVACVDKANVFRAFAFMRQIAEERAAAFPNVGFEPAYVDAVALKMVQNPAQYDVLVTENMF